MTVKLNVRVTSKSKCRDGFYLVMNGERIRFKTRAAAVDSVVGWLKFQRIQIVTVREYAERDRKKISARMPPLSGLGYAVEPAPGKVVTESEP